MLISKTKSPHLALLLATMFGFVLGVASSGIADEADDPKEPSKVEVAADEKSDSKPEAKMEAKVETKPEAKAEPRDDDSQPHELSTAPQDYPIYPEDRPMWVDQPDKIGDDWAELVVQSVPSLSADSSRESLLQQQKIALIAYIDQALGFPGAGEKIVVPAEQIASGLVDPDRTYNGKLTTSTGEMFQHASVLVLDDDFHSQITQQWQSLEVAQRLKGLGVLAALALVGLSGLTVLLKSISPRPKAEHDDRAAMA
ncbi:hypothetical protein EC9_54800 [Rosistilla ulvae]|uniref:Uncharacterized protein n=1 Tax=Rosistilla ulvae TaxID=1930277 RepID=A0A517M8P4_9BACT|nr:hypothetical protein [Rosistilla ulvae]QDS91256.1 hypothetical protein EC9_54800 [Rosistilla ulvae]